MSSSILDKYMVVLVYFLRSGVPPRSASVNWFPTWTQGGSSKEVPLAGPHVQEISRWVTVGLAMVATNRIVVVVGSCTDRTI